MLAVGAPGCRGAVRRTYVIDGAVTLHGFYN
jgi:hypothetical protein